MQPKTASKQDEQGADGLMRMFPPEKAGLPYNNDNEYTGDLMSLVSLCLISTVGYAADYADAAAGDEYFAHLPGLAMGLGEAMTHVGGRIAPRLEQEPETLKTLTAAREYIDKRLGAAKASGFEPCLERLRRLLALTDFSFFCLACAISSALDRGVERLFMKLNGEVSIPCPTLGAAQACYSMMLPGQEHPGGLQNDSSLENRLLYLPVPPNMPHLLRPLFLRPAALGYILGEWVQSRALAPYCERVTDVESLEEPIFLKTQEQIIRMWLYKSMKNPGPRLCVLHGAAGSGKRLTLARAAREEGAKLLLVRLDELPLDDSLDELAALCTLWGIIPCFTTEENAGGAPRLARVLTALGPSGIGAVLLVSRLRGNIAPEGWMVSRVDYPMPDLDQSLRYWRLFSEGYETAPDFSPEQLAAKYTLPPGKIRAALRTASDMAMFESAPVDASKLDAAILLGNTGRLSEIADKIEAYYTWDDLVLGDVPKQMLRDVCNRVKYRVQMETKWGFGGKSSYGKGLSILLYGPPGTGKTMSAQVIAGELWLPLYRINLAQIISKYIGETAKNLDAVFNEARSSNVILFFDEADALFAKRTDVKNSNDRHANSESSYLLQKIEEYSGISILATNLASNFDEAFRRRIHYMINIHMPSPDQRLELWKNALPAKAPLAPDVDLELLANHLEFSGSVIKSAALQAAYFAASEGEVISMAHLTRAIRMELQKLGKSEPHILNRLG